MSNLIYVHKSLGEVVMGIHAWEVSTILRFIATINAKEQTISNVTIKSN